MIESASGVSNTPWWQRELFDCALTWNAGRRARWYGLSAVA